MPEITDEQLRAALAYILFGGGAGSLVYGIIEFFDNLWVEGLPPNFKFWGAQFLSVMIPLIAYGLYLRLNDKPLTAGGVFLAVTIAYQTSVSIHRVVSSMQRNRTERLLDAAVDIEIARRDQQTSFLPADPAVLLRDRNDREPLTGRE